MNPLNNNSVAAPEPPKNKPVKLKLRKDLLVDMTNHPKGPVVDVEHFRAKRLVEAKAAFRLDKNGEIVPDIDEQGNPLPVEAFEEDED